VKRGSSAPSENFSALRRALLKYLLQPDKQDITLNDSSNLISSASLLLEVTVTQSHLVYKSRTQCFKSLFHFQ